MGETNGIKRPVIFIVESGGLCGGVRVILEEALRLSQRGWNVCIYSIGREPHWFPMPPDMWRKFQDYEHLKTVLVAEDGWKVATWWKTAQVVNECLRGDEGCYLVQDIEVEYYSAPRMKEMVMATYDLPLRKYTTSRWVEANLPDTTWVGIGLDLDLYRPLELERDPATVLAFPRKQRLKGFRQLGELSRRLGQNISLVTVGVMPIQLGGAWKRHYTGLPDREIVRLYNQIACFVSTTLHEGFGLPHIEAMACGTPVITTDANGNMTFCEDGKNCLVYDGDDMAGMAMGVHRVLTDEALWKSLARHGLETAAEYPWGPVIDRLEAFLLA